MKKKKQLVGHAHCKVCGIPVDSLLVRSGCCKKKANICLGGTVPGVTEHLDDCKWLQWQAAYRGTQFEFKGFPFADTKCFPVGV